MTEDHPPLDAYLGGELADELAHTIDDHLLDCTQCWREVELARAARTAVRRSAELLPADVRYRLQTRLATVENRPAGAPAACPQRGHNRHTMLTAAIAVVALLAGFTLGAALWHGSARVERALPSAGASGSSTASPQMDPDAGGALAAAVMCFQDQQLPGAAVPTQPAPDLTRLGLHVMAGGAGQLDQHPTDAYAYASEQQSVFVFVATAPFTLTATPVADGRYLIDGLTVVATTEHPMLVVGADAALVSAVATVLT